MWKQLGDIYVLAKSRNLIYLVVRLASQRVNLANSLIDIVSPSLSFPGGFTSCKCRSCATNSEQKVSFYSYAITGKLLYLINVTPGVGRFRPRRERI